MLEMQKLINELSYIKSNQLWRGWLNNSDKLHKALDLIAEICKSEISKNDVFYRARLLSAHTYPEMELVAPSQSESGIHGFSPNEMGAPPASKASAGRANEKGIPFLYLGKRPETACSEVHPTFLDFLSVAKFKLTKTINIVNLKSFEGKNLKSIDNIECFQKLEIDNVDVLKNIILIIQEFFSLPVRDNNKAAYRISQKIAVYFQSKGFDGILYGSMYAMSSNYELPDEQSTNLVLFNQDSARCSSIKTDVYQFLRRKLTFQNISNYDKILVAAKSNIKKILETTDIEYFYKRFQHDQKKDKKDDSKRNRQIIDNAQKAYQKYIYQTNNVRLATQRANNITKCWQRKSLDISKIKSEVSIGDLKQKIDIVDFHTMIAYEMRVSENNPQHELYKDIFKVLVYNEKNNIKIKKLVFITPQNGLKKLIKGNKETMASFIQENIAEDMGIEIEFVSLTL